MFRRRKRSFEDFQTEIESHIGLEADEIRATASCADSDAAARRAFGNVAAVEEQWYEYGRWMFLDYLGRELRHGVRLIRQRPGFSLFMILTLAIGIGANSTIFSLPSFQLA
jgi:macrolide transport system ATP-binding/permease protein